MRTIVITLLALAVAGGLVAWRWRAGAARGALQFETAPVDRGRIVAKVTATGTLSALVTVQVGTQVSGRVQELFADFNAVVKKDQVLAHIDPLFFQAALDQAQATLTIAEGNLAKAQVQATDADRQLLRQQALFSQKIVTQSDLDTADTTAKSNRALVTVATGNVAQAQAQLTQAKVNLDYTTIRSPVDGVVISRNVDVGQTVAASLQAPVLFTIAEDLKKMQVDTSVAEGDVGKLAAGIPVSFTVDAYPGEQFGGSVRQIRYNAQTLQNVVTYDAVIDVENRDLKLRPGMTANAAFTWADKADVLRVPNAALRFRPPVELNAALAAVSEAPAPAAADAAGTAAPPAGGAGKAAEGTPPAGAAAKPPEAATAAGADGAGPEHHHRRADAAAGDGGEAAAGGRQHGGARDRRTVWALRDGVAVPIKVRLGTSDGTRTEVVSGDLTATDQVITDSTGGTAAAGPAAASPFGLGPPPGGPGPRRGF